MPAATEHGSFPGDAQNPSFGPPFSILAGAPLMVLHGGVAYGSVSAAHSSVGLPRLQLSNFPHPKQGSSSLHARSHKDEEPEVIDLDVEFDRAVSELRRSLGMVVNLELCGVTLHAVSSGPQAQMSSSSSTGTVPSRGRTEIPLPCRSMMSDG